MSADKYQVWYYLTERGWVLCEDDDSPEPERWIRLYEMSYEQGSSFGRGSSRQILLRQNKDWRDEDADQIEKRVGPPNRNPTNIAELLKRINTLSDG